MVCPMTSPTNEDQIPYSLGDATCLEREFARLAILVSAHGRTLHARDEAQMATIDEVNRQIGRLAVEIALCVGEVSKWHSLASGRVSR